MTEQHYDDIANINPNNEPTVICPECGLPVPVSMSKCPYCGIRMPRGCKILAIQVAAAIAAIIVAIVMLCIYL
ncbi:MAG: hypothetical protein IKA70_00450 [Alistipes sp.]|nr:hypothetical protein [Alistipes sp.]MBR2975628.1 hypothetical protein [Alistipes sp.]